MFQIQVRLSQAAGCHDFLRPVGVLLPAVQAQAVSPVQCGEVIQAEAYEHYAQCQEPVALHVPVLSRSAHPVTADHDEPFHPRVFPPGDQRRFPVPELVLSGNSGP
ncbi:hypothetical protein BW70_03550 [Escherichia coli O174:H8 str. 04-3038]|nr:hypothetical protein BW70_03550 [Escherichia coli O174:H8 str. 04-3038]